MNSDSFAKEKEEIEVLEKDLAVSVLYLFNDDYNTFEHVIESLIEICGHSEEQAIQCTFLVHFKGKSDVKNGEYKELVKPLMALLNRGLSAKII